MRFLGFRKTDRVMAVFFLRNGSVARAWAGQAACCAGLMLLFLAQPACLADDTNLSPSVTIDLAKPSVMTGTFYEIGSDRKKILFKYRRSAKRDGDNVFVEQLFTQPDGSVACRERIHYRNDLLVSYEMEDPRAGTQGSILIERDLKKPKREQILLSHAEHQGAKITKDTEILQPNTLISDTIYPFILTRWDELMQGGVVKFHLISLDPPDVFNFRLQKEGETTWEGKPVVRIRMEPTNLIVGHFIKPIYFLIETAAPHRVFSYTGRTTPQAKVDGAWKFVEAEAVFDWK
jgi:hypothetical protein